MHNYLNDANQIVLIGLTQQQLVNLPSGIIGISRTDSVQELNEWYAIADLFINPTVEDNYPTTNLEAISSGTPVISFKTGGSPESARIYGTVIEKYNVKELIKEVNKNNFYDKKEVDVSYQEMIRRYMEVYL